MICGNIMCAKSFQAGTHNQVYCSPECCRVATNERIKAEYHANKARLNGAKRSCSCGNLLSRYNPGKICSTCEAKKSTQRRNQVLEHFGVSLTSVKA